MNFCWTDFQRITVCIFCPFLEIGLCFSKGDMLKNYPLLSRWLFSQWRTPHRSLQILWMIEVRMNVEWALHHNRVWSPGWWRDEYWYLPFLGAQTDPGKTDMTFTLLFFCWFRSRILGLFGKHHNDINEIKEWSIDIAGLHNCCRFSGRDCLLRVTLPLVCIVYWVVALLSFLLLSKRKAYSWLKWKLKAELSAASTITRNIKVQQTIMKERISCPWLLLGRHKSQHHHQTDFKIFIL